jgi:hypothetical protein
VSITVVGSIAYDGVKTPFGERERMLGGAATHFALAASFFDRVRPVGPIGEDFADGDLEILATRGTDVGDVERVAGGRTFLWKGEYGWDLNSRTTLDTQLNVFEDFSPELSAEARSCDVLFLANIQPTLQAQVLDQVHGPAFTALDSMNLWIDIARDALVSVIERVDCLILNDAELRQLTGKPSLLAAAREVLGWAPPPSWPSGASTVPRSSRLTRSSPCPRIRWRRWWIRPARGTRSPEGSWATSRGTSARASTRKCSAAPWPTGRHSPPSTSRRSARSGWCG